MTRVLGLAAVLWMTLLRPAPAAPAAVADPRGPGTRSMAQRLEKLAAESNPAGNRFLSEGRVRLIRAALAGNPPEEQAVSLEFDLAMELLNCNENVAAIAQFDRFEKRVRAAGFPLGIDGLVNLRLSQALAHLRMGELTNCVANHSSESCLLPITGRGRHQWEAGSRNAMVILTNLLHEVPTNLAARWLLNVAGMTVGDYPAKIPAAWLIPPAVFASDHDIRRFPEVGGPAGLAVRELSGGSAAEDFDGDGLIDLMVTSIGLRDPMHFFHNNGDGTFADRTRVAGLEGLTGGLNLVTTDYNNDGWPDVLVLRGAWMREEGRFPNSLLRNNGDGTFEDVTEAAGLLSFHPTQTAAWFDFDGDGWLDLFIGNETSPGSPAHACELYRNNRDGTFSEIAAGSGVAVRAFVKGVTVADYNNDGRPDLYLSMLRRPNILFRNDGPKPVVAGAKPGWKFTEVSIAAGVRLPTDSFVTWFFDYDNDGWEDLYVGGYRIDGVGDIAADVLGLPGRGERAKLYHNRGDGTFEDATAASRLDRVLHGMGANFGDLDNDGWLDFYIGTGDPDLLTIVPNRMLRNAGGKYFQDVTTSGGFGHLQKGHGVSFADFDNDGDQDIHEDMGGAVSGDLYPNVLFANPGHGSHWLKLQLVGQKANRPGLGARLKITVNRPGGQRVIQRTVGTGGSFGGNPLRQEIGLGDATQVAAIEILWPGSGTRQMLKDLAVDQCYRVTEGVSSPEVVKLKAFSLPAPDSKAHSHDHRHH